MVLDDPNLNEKALKSSKSTLDTYPEELRATSWRDISHPSSQQYCPHSQEVKATQISISEWKDKKKNVVETHNEILFSLEKKKEKEIHPAMGYNADEAWGNMVKWNKPVRRWQTPYDFTYIHKVGKCAETQRRIVMARVGGREKWVVVCIQFQFYQMKMLWRSTVRQRDSI